jgi:hypothetical protein
MKEDRGLGNVSIAALGGTQLYFARSIWQPELTRRVGGSE